jgi:urease beta subunit
VRFEPGDTKTVTLVEIAGNKVIRGGNNFASGAVNEQNKQTAIERMNH